MRPAGELRSNYNRVDSVENNDCLPLEAAATS